MNSSSSAIWQPIQPWALPECWYWIRKAQARFLAGDYVGALDASAKGGTDALGVRWSTRNGRVSLLRRA